MMPDCPLPASSSNLNPNAVRHHLIKRITFKLHYGVPHQPQRKTKQDRSSKREKNKIKTKKSLDALALFMVQHPNPLPPAGLIKNRRCIFIMISIFHHSPVGKVELSQATNTSEMLELFREWKMMHLVGGLVFCCSPCSREKCIPNESLLSFCHQLPESWLARLQEPLNQSEKSDKVVLEKFYKKITRKHAYEIFFFS